MDVSLVARRHGVSASQLFSWRKLERDGALTAAGSGESVVPASELAAARAQLQRMLGKKTMEAEILKEAVEFAPEKSELRARPYWARTLSEAGLFCSWRSAIARFADADAVRELGS